MNVNSFCNYLEEIGLIDGNSLNPFLLLFSHAIQSKSKASGKIDNIYESVLCSYLKKILQVERNFRIFSQKVVDRFKVNLGRKRNLGVVFVCGLLNNKILLSKKCFFSKLESVKDFRRQNKDNIKYKESNNIKNTNSNGKKEKMQQRKTKKNKCGTEQTTVNLDDLSKSNGFSVLKNTNKRHKNNELDSQSFISRSSSLIKTRNVENEDRTKYTDVSYSRINSNLNYTFDYIQENERNKNDKNFSKEKLLNKRKNELIFKLRKEHSILFKRNKHSDKKSKSIKNIVSYTNLKKIY